MIAVIVPLFNKIPGLVTVSRVATVRVLLFVSVTPVTVTFGMVKVPVSACALVLNVCAPVPALKVPLLVIPPRNVIGEFAEVLAQVPLALIVTKPVKSFAPLAEDMVKLPLVPAPTVVVPVTVNANPAAVKVVPSPIARFPVIVNPTTVVVNTVPLRVRVPLIVVVRVCKTSVPLPLKVR